MLGERRSKEAFHGDIPESVQDTRSTGAACPAPVMLQTVANPEHASPAKEQAIKQEHAAPAKTQIIPPEHAAPVMPQAVNVEHPAPAMTEEEYLESLLQGCLKREAGGQPAPAEDITEKERQKVPLEPTAEDTTEKERQKAPLEPAVEETRELARQEDKAPVEEPAEETLDEQEAYEPPKRVTRTLRTHSLFFAADTEGRDFSSVLKEVQTYLSKEYSSLVTAEGSEEVKSQIRRFAGKYIQDHRISVPGMSTDELIGAIYSEMAEFGFLTKYVYGEGIEEIDINAWDDVEVQFAGGVTKKLEEHFDSPEHAINVVRRMLHVSGMVLDDASPSVLGHLSKNIRIAVLKTPIVDADVGVAASIRIVNPQSMKKQDFIKGGTATVQMLDFLAECIRYGISVCVAGATSSGKTTLLGWLLTTIPDGKRIYSIENGSRELALVRRKEGRVVNSVIHTLTRDSENERQRVDQIALLDMALRFNPDIIVVGEMRGPEANAAQEAARTGVAVVTTIHSMSCDATYRRMVSLCKRAVDMSDETLMGFVTEAYPIVAFCKQLENKERRLMEIMECEILPDGTRKFRPLFQYQITENRVEDGKFIIKGSHRQVNPISEGLARRLMENGMPQEMLSQLLTVPGQNEKRKEGTPL